MAEWWEQFARDVAGQAKGIAEPIQQGIQDFTRTAPMTAAMFGINALRFNPFTAPGATVASQVFGKAPNYANRKPASQSFGGPDRRTPAPPPQPEGLGGMTDEELLAWLLGGSGGGAPDLSGYNTMIGDVNKRRDQLNIRKWQQRKFLGDLFDAAEARAMSDRSALSAAVEEQLAADSARRQAEMGIIRADDAGRLATSNEARAALGVAGGPDVASEVAQNAVAGVGASGAVSDRDARINQAIQSQQFNAEIAGLVPAEQMAVGQLMGSYEDRLAALASERAAIQAQIAQARASARGSGPSTSEKLAALSFLEEQGAGPDLPAAIGGQAILQTFAANDPRNAAVYSTIYNSIAPLLSSYTMSGTGKMQDATELANAITRDNPGLINSGPARDFLQQLVKDYLG